MTPNLRFRLVAFGAIILVLGVLAVTSAVTAWMELGTLRRRFTSAEFEAFRIAGELQSSVLELNTSLLGFAGSGDEEEWKRFESDGAKLNGWIDQQRDALKTAREKRVLSEIDTEYDRYLAVAQTMRQHGDGKAAPVTTRVASINEATLRMFKLAQRLAEAHRAALGDLLGQSQHSLRRLEALFAAGFVLIAAVGFWGARIFFRETITPLRKQLIESQALAERHEKLASLGVLAAGVAREIRNPLMALKLRAYLLRQNLEDAVPAGEDVAVIENEIARLERIVSDFLLFARPGDPKLTSISPLVLLREVGELLAPELARSDVTLVVEPGPEEPELLADPHQLKQVLLNLVRNGAESIGQKGSVTLRVREDHLPLNGRLQQVVVLEVQDTGAGIPPEVQERLFDPFFTTKSAGTGLGLSIAIRILEKHGGTLQFQTAPGHGTTFGVVLPIPPAKSSIAAETPRAQPSLAA